MTIPENPTERVKPRLDEIFRFSMGDHVQLSTLTTLCSREVLQALTPPSLSAPIIIVGRKIDECPGGVQLHYQLCGTGLPNIWHLEHSIVPYREYQEAVLEAARFSTKLLLEKHTGLHTQISDLERALGEANKRAGGDPR